MICSIVTSDAVIAKSRGKNSQTRCAPSSTMRPMARAEGQRCRAHRGVAYREELEKELKTKLGYKEADKLPIVKSGDYSRVEAESLGLDEGEKIAVIYATGDIGSGQSENSPSRQSVDRFRHAFKGDRRCSRRQNDQGYRYQSRQSRWFGSGVRHHLALSGCGKRKEAGGDLDERRRCFRWLLHLPAAPTRSLLSSSTITGSIGASPASRL